MPAIGGVPYDDPRVPFVLLVLRCPSTERGAVSARVEKPGEDGQRNP